MFGDQQPQGHGEVLAGTHSPHEVGEEREAAMVGHMRNGVYEDAEYFRHDVFDCGSGCGLLWRQWVWLLVRGAAVTMGSCESGEYGGARLCMCVSVCSKDVYWVTEKD